MNVIDYNSHAVDRFQSFNCYYYIPYLYSTFHTLEYTQKVLYYFKSIMIMIHV